MDSARLGSQFTPAAIGARLDRLPISRWHWKIKLLVGLAAFFDLYEVSVSGVLGRVLGQQWDLARNVKAALIAAPFFGMIFGAIFLGMASDRSGRRRMFMINLGVYSLLSVVGAFAPNTAFLIAIRFLCGIFTAAELIRLVWRYGIVAGLQPLACRSRSEG